MFIRFQIKYFNGVALRVSSLWVLGLPGLNIVLCFHQVLFHSALSFLEAHLVPLDCGKV